jgi:hypothetical protein
MHPSNRYLLLKGWEERPLAFQVVWGSDLGITGRGRFHFSMNLVTPVSGTPRRMLPFLPRIIDLVFDFRF